MTNGWGRTAADMLDGGTPNELLGRTSWTTGFATLDATLGGGLHAGELTLLGGAQGLGKTTLALQMARGIARSGGRAAYVCYEHTEEELLARLLLMESGLLAPFDDPLPRQALRGGDLSADDERRLTEAGASVRKYGERLRLVRGWGRTGQGALDTVADALDGAALFVDYLQKVPSDRPAADEDERVTVVVERLKDIALTRDVPVVAIVASDKSGLASGRMRLRDLRGSTALAYEADVALLLNDKMSVVAKHHLVYGSPEAARFPDYVVCTIEKNRSGRAGVDLELRKRFSHGHFEPADRVVAERLLDERVYVE